MPSIEYDTYEGIKIAGHPNHDEIFLKYECQQEQHKYISPVAKIRESVMTSVEKNPIDQVHSHILKV